LYGLSLSGIHGSSLCSDVLYHLKLGIHQRILIGRGFSFSQLNRLNNFGGTLNNDASIRISFCNGFLLLGGLCTITGPCSRFPFSRMMILGNCRADSFTVILI